jgi:transcriptional regulator with XRE-family HTH domain
MNKEDFLKLGYKIKYQRSKQGLSQLNLALKTGLTTRTISRLECGTIDPKYSTLVRISEALNIELVDLLAFTL